MNTQYFSDSSKGRLAIVLVGILLGPNVLASAQVAKKPAAVPPKLSAPPKSAAPSKPAAVTHTNPNGPTTKGRTTDGTATAQHPMANRGNPPKTTATMQKSVNTQATEHPTLTASKGSFTQTAANGARVKTRANGQVADLHDPKRNIDIHHGLDGSRRVSVVRPDGRRLVAEGDRRGYVQRSYSFHGHDFAARSYYFHGREYNRYYRGFSYNGVHLNVYAPGYYYSPGFYGWAYNPWSAPIAYGWGWGASPWLGFYGGFFTPFASYPSAAFWLTDYMIAADLQAAYSTRVGGGAEIAVSPTQTWTDTSMQVVQGQTYIITASGLINILNGNPNWFETPRGRSDCVAGADPNRAVPQLSCAMMGKIGPAGVPFEVGSSLTLVAPVSGEFYLGMNDSNYSDNSGGWVATVTQSSAPDNAGGLQAASSGRPALTPEVKQLIADEVKNQLALENAEAAQTTANQDVDAGSSGIARTVADVAAGHPHIFVVGGGLDVTEASSGQECHVSDGDALQMATAPAADATAANVFVKASKGGVECAPGTTVAVNLTDLQEMQNHMRENIDEGLKELQAKQGQGGLPKAPLSAQGPPVQPQYAAIAPPPAPEDAADIQAQNKRADQAEAEALGNPTSSFAGTQ